MGDLDGAIAAYQRALQLRPDYALAHYNLALTLRMAGRDEEARKYFAEAQRLDPTLEAPE